ncbi:MAG: endo-1,4-beta-xylanase [Tannerellaceae bacterium]|nr:endo-1,4-beta-xylanase [Tannerellaceae bacterium]
MKNVYILTFLLCAWLAGSCQQEKFDSDNSIPVIPAVSGSLSEAPFPFGAAVNISPLNSSDRYKEILRSDMSRVTAENAMKMNNISKGHKQYDFTEADKIVQFAIDNGLEVHGHTLLWYKHTPSWVSNFEGSREQWIAIMKEYIQDVVGHFKGKVVSWDVINEVINDDGEVYIKDGDKYNIWLDKIGEEYISLAFKYAHEADPNALLFYNEYGHEYSSQRRMGVNNLVKELKEKNIPIHGVGMQMHTNINRSTSDLRNAIMIMAASTRLKIHVSELDIAVNPSSNKELELTDELLEKQQIHYREVAKAMNDLPADQQFGITFWGVCDSNSWLYANPDWPLPYDDTYAKKPAYEGLLQGFKVSY